MNAAAASDIGRFYLRAALLVVLFVRSAAAQPQSVEPPPQPTLGMTLTADWLRELPANGNPLTAIDAMQVEAISDRFVAAGLSTATPPRAGGLLNSWTQTQFRIGDVNITDARTGGAPLLLPFMPFFSRVSIAAGAMALDDHAAALSIGLEPVRPGSSWQRAFEGFATAGPLTPDPGDLIRPIDRVDRWADGSAVVSGPLSPRAGLAAGGSWRGLSHVELPSSSAATDRVATGFAHLSLAATDRDSVSAIGFVQRTTTAAFTDRSVHTQGTWVRAIANQWTWRAFAGYTERKRTNAPTPRTVVVDSLTSDPISDLFDTGGGSSRRWTVGARIVPDSARNLPTVGVDVDNARARIVPTTVGQFREYVDGVPARVWTVNVPAMTDFRHVTTIAAFVEEHARSGRFTVDGGLRLDSTRARADAATDGISWTTLLPRARVQWQWTRKADVAVTAAYRRSAYQVPLNVLAIGDPAAPTADVARLTATSVGPLIARIGPGSGGDPAFSAIDPALKRPVTDELVLAIRARPFAHFEVELARVVKRESPLLQVADTGVPFSTYLTLFVPDPSYVASTAGPFDRPLAPAYSRPPGSYGRDRYLLTNVSDDPGKSWAMELNVRVTGERVTFFAGGALTWAYAPAAAIGFLPTENDQNVLGNLFVDVNRASFARGQLFQDRSHTVKMAGVYRFPSRFSIGAIARYQDGQPFARLVSVPVGLTQGPMLVRAYRNGGAAFTYTGTLDARAQQIFTVGRTEITAGVDVYNVPGMKKEVSEYVVAGPLFRTPTALQPPRTAIASLRVAF